MAGEQKLQDLKDQIDINKENGMEIKEMEDFSNSEENMVTLGKAMEDSISPELKKEFENSIKECCKEIIKKNPKEITENQLRILSFYLEYFYSETDTENIEGLENAMKELCNKIITGKSENVTENQFRILLFYLDYFCPEINNPENIEKQGFTTGEWETKKENLEENVRNMKKKLDELHKNLEARKESLEQINNAITLLQQEKQLAINRNEEKENNLNELQEEYEQNQRDYKAKEEEYTTTQIDINNQEAVIYGMYGISPLKKGNDKTFYKVCKFVCEQRSKYEQEVLRWKGKMEKRDQEELNGKNGPTEKDREKQERKHQTKLDKNPLYRMLAMDESSQELKNDLRKIDQMEAIQEIENKMNNVIETAIKEYEECKKQVQTILDKEGTLTEEEKKTLNYFIYYYQSLNNTYIAKENPEARTYIESKHQIGELKKDNINSGELIHNYDINKTISNYGELFSKRLEELGLSEGGINGWKITQLYNPEEKDNGSPIRKIIRGKLLGDKTPTNIDEGLYDQIARKIDRKLNPEVFEIIDNFNNNGINLTNKNLDQNLKKINQRYNEFGENHPDAVKGLKDKVDNYIKSITDKKLKNENINNLTKNEIGIFQLWANIEYGENLTIDGTKSSLTKNDKISNGETTTLYIYRQMLSSRESKEYTHIEKIPNINDLLNNIKNLNDRNLLFKRFLVDFFLPIKDDSYGKIIENSIQAAYNEANQGKPFARILTLLINQYIIKTNGTSNIKIITPGSKKGEIQVTTRGNMIDDRIKGRTEELNHIHEAADSAEMTRRAIEEYKNYMKQAHNRITQIENNSQKILQIYNNATGSNDVDRFYAKGEAGKYFEACQSEITQLIIINQNINNLRGHGLPKECQSLDINEIQEGFVGFLHMFFTKRELEIYYGKRYPQRITISKKLEEKAIREGKETFSQNAHDLDLLGQINAPISSDPFKYKNRRGFNIYTPNRSEMSSFNYGSGRSEYKPETIEVDIQIPGNEILSGSTKLTRQGTRNYLQVKTADSNEIQELMERANRKEINLVLDLEAGYPISLKNFAIVKEQKTGYTLTYQGESKERKTINKKIENRENIAMSQLFTDEEFRTITNCLEDIQNDMSSISNYVEGVLTNGKNFNSTQFQELQQRGQNIIDMKNNLRRIFKDPIQVYINKLNGFAQGNIKSQNDKGIENAIEALRNIDEFLDPNDKTVERFVASLANEDFREKDGFWESIGDRIKKNAIPLICGIIAGIIFVAAVGVSGGTALAMGPFFATLRNAGMMALGGSLGGYVGQEVNRQLDIKLKERIPGYGGNTYTVTDGNGKQKTITTHSGDQQSILHDLAKGEISINKFLDQFGNDRYEGTKRGFIFMYGGQYLSKGVSSIFNNPKYASRPRAAGLKKAFENMPFSKRKQTDKYAQNLFDNIGNSLNRQSGALAEKSFMQNFWSECGEEFREEIIENGAEAGANSLADASGCKPLGLLAFAVTFWHSMAPHGHLNSSLYIKNKITFDGFNLMESSKSIVMTLAYNGDFEAIKKHLTSEEIGFTYNEENGTFSKTNDVNDKYTNVIKLQKIEGQETNEQFKTRSLVSDLTFYGISMDHNSGEIYYSDTQSLLDLRQKRLLSGDGTVDIDSQTGSVTICDNASGQTIHLQPHPMITLIEAMKESMSETDFEEISSGDNGLYFNGKPHRFPVNEEQAIENSKFMDEILNEDDNEGGGGGGGGGGNEDQKIRRARERIKQYYNQIGGKNLTGKDLELTDEQVKSIIEAHRQKGVLGNLEPEELRRKNEILSETIKDKDIRRFLFEAGFCGSLKLGTDNIGSIKKMNEQDIKNLINRKPFTDYYYDKATKKNVPYEVKIEEMTINDLEKLMRKAANIGLDIKTIGEVKKKINERITTLREEYTKTKNNNKLEKLHNLEKNIKKISFEVEIKNINPTASDFETKIFELEDKIIKEFGADSKTYKELKVELNRKKFEYYKINNRLNEAKYTIEEMESLNKSLLSEDITNFKYKRGLLDVELLKIQLGDEKALEGLQENAQELRDDAKDIGGRTDIETLLSKIEAGILLGKPQEELDAYLSLLAIQEFNAGANILGNVISTVSTTLTEKELIDSAGRMKKAGESDGKSDLDKKFKDKYEDLINKGKIAENNANKYIKMKENLSKDKNGVEMKKLQDIINKFIYETPIESVSDFGNHFLQQLQLFNYSVASIEISENTYSKVREILTGSRSIKRNDSNRHEFDVKIEGGINMEGNRDPTPEGFRGYMLEVNQKLDGFIRTLYSTEQLQELNGASHSAGYDANIKSYLEKIGLNDLAQVIELYGIADCRVHAFTKQILFDTMKRTQLQNLQKKLNSETDPIEIEKLKKQIKLLKKTKMVYVDSTLTGNVRMKAKYQAEKDDTGHLIGGDENAVIEEHTYNLIEIPTIDEKGNVTGKEVFYADSFYQGTDGKVYNLSFDPTKPIDASTIYGRTYYTKNKKGKYEHNPKINMCMMTEVIGSNGEKIPITSVPLFRSIQGRGDNFIPGNLETEVLSQDDIARQNTEARNNAIAISQITEVRTKIQNTMIEALNKGDIGKLKEILENGINTKIQYNSENGKREYKDGNIKINETQAKFLKRAIDICENYGKGNIPKNMQDSLTKMLNCIVTQDEVNYRLKSGDISDVEERMGVFWNNVQIFNEAYYVANINEAMENLIKHPNDSECIKKFMDAVIKYQNIFDEDMGDFLKQTQKTMVKENERNETYHRNNFKHIAERFQADMKVYSKAVKTLESVGLFKQAYEIRTYMVEQGNTLLEHSDKLLGHMIDFKKVKKEMKGLKGREIYNQLKEIQSKNIRNLKTAFQNSGLNRNYIKEITGMDENAPLNKENLDKAISNIKDSGLKDYYDTISLVFNSELLAINMENAVYSSNPIYTLETENGRIFSIETEEEYIKRKNSQTIFEQHLNDNTQPDDIKEFCERIVDGAAQKLSNGNEKDQIKSTISELIHLCKINGIKGKAMYDLCKISTEALIFQTIESKTRSMGDHGINHISGNIAKLNTYLEAGVKGGKIPAGEVGKYKLMGALTHIFHDIGYAAIISKGSNSFDGSNIHPFTSKMFFEEIVEGILGNAKINTSLIKKAIESHDGIRLNWGTPETTFLSMVNLSDNMALGTDKISEIRTNPHLLKHISTLYALDAAGIDITKAHEIMIEEIEKDGDLDGNQIETLKSAIKEISKFSMGNVDFRSISPLTTMEFNGKVPTLNMFKGVNLMLVAEVCGIDSGKLKTAIDNNDRNAVIELLKGPDGKGTKFCSQIIKPLGDYCDIYTIYDAKGKEYPKVDGEYDWNEIKADLLLGKTISLGDGNKSVLNYKYAEATKGPNGSIEAENNSVYGNMLEKMDEALGKGVEAMITVNESQIIKYLSSLRKTTNEIINNIKETKEIETKETIESINATIGDLERSIYSLESLGDSRAIAIRERFRHFKEDITLFNNYLNENKYSELKVAAKTIQEEIDMLSSLLVKE